MAEDLVSTTLVYCQHCGTPLFELRSDGCLVFKMKHHGQKHVSLIHLRELLRLLRPEERPGT